MPGVVKRVTGKKKIAKKPAPRSDGKLALPDRPKTRTKDFSKYTTLIYGREGVGKTTLAASFPDVLFFCTEPGSRALEIYELNSGDGGVRNWPIFRQGVRLLEVERGRFKNVAVDTADRAYDMCLDWVCKERGVSHPSDMNDYGATWHAVKAEFMTQMHRIIHAGYGLLFTSHATENEVKARDGASFHRIAPSMSGQARKVIEAFVDFVFFADYFRCEGETVRALVTKGDDLVTAKDRTDSFPMYLPMEKTGGYETLLAGFRGEHEGLDPAVMRPSTQTSRAGEAKAKKERAQAVSAGRRGKEE